jgi:glycogen phosphorylase
MFQATSLSVRDRLVESLNDTNAYYDSLCPKRVSYLSMEYLLGRSLKNALLNMDLDSQYRDAVNQLGVDLEELYNEEPDAGLGNGGLGRLAACYIDSLATLNIPAVAYGIYYSYGLFKQIIDRGHQVEIPDFWLARGASPWEIERSDVRYNVHFYGSIEPKKIDDSYTWSPGETVVGIAHDIPIPGFDTYNVNILRLFRAAPSSEFDFMSFNQGDYLSAVQNKQRAEQISAVLYPNDNFALGKELRLKQEYFLSSCSIQDIIAKFKSIPNYNWTLFPKFNSIQLNDTHPVLSIPELIRFLVDVERLSFSDAFNIAKSTFNYTNHTVLSEALEKWSVDLVQRLLPRHMDIIFKINYLFLEDCRLNFHISDIDQIRRLSIIEEGNEKKIRMANLAIACSSSVNGVAELHSKILKEVVFPDFQFIFPNKFTNVTNGVTPRRWIHSCNPELSALLTKWLDSDAWLVNLSLLACLKPVYDHPSLISEFQSVKLANKVKLQQLIQKECNIVVNTSSLFDMQVKRIHEYKRQLLNALYCIHHYLDIKKKLSLGDTKITPRVSIFAGKAAPGYFLAKKIIELINNVSNVVNEDQEVGDLYKVVFLPDYSVSKAEVLVPSSDLSEHSKYIWLCLIFFSQVVYCLLFIRFSVSLSGMEASGTSCMKFAMNGGLIIGTHDGANIEIAEEIGKENMFLFGALSNEVNSIRLQRKMKGAGVDLSSMYCPELLQVLEELSANDCNNMYGNPELLKPILHSLEFENDYYLVTHDFKSYIDTQALADSVYCDRDEWARRCLMSIASMGKFSTDRSISEYCSKIWGVSSHKRQSPIQDPVGRSRSFPSLLAPTFTSDQKTI